MSRATQQQSQWCRCVRAVVVVAGLLGVWPRVAIAQATLVVRAGDEPSRAVEAAIDDALCDTLGGSVRRVESSMDELALAAGCEGPAAEPECVATIARAASVRILALERIVREADAWRIALDLRRADGTRIRELRIRCADGPACATALDDGFAVRTSEEFGNSPLAVGPAPDTATHATSATRVTPASETSARSDHVRRAIVASEPTHEAATSTLVSRPDIALGPDGSSSDRWPAHALLGSAVVAAVGAATSGGLALGYAGEVSGLGRLRTEADVDRAHALDDQSVVALGVGIGFALVGAGLSIAGTVVLTAERGAGPRITASPLALTVTF